MRRLIASGVFAAHFRKELRENRGAWVGISVIVLVACPFAVYFYGSYDDALADLPITLALAAAWLGVLGLGGEAISRELSVDRRSALSRIPGGLLRPFLARLLVYACGVVGLGILAFAWTAASLLVWVGDLPVMSALPDYKVGYWVTAIGGSFTLVTSCWLRQSMLAAPAGVILVGLLSLPLVMEVGEEVRALELITSDAPVVAPMILVAGLIGAWASFGRGMRRGGGRRSAILAGSVTVFLLAIPVYGLTYDRVREWSYLDPSMPSFVVDDVWIGEGGRYAFVNAGQIGSRGDREKPGHAYLVDLSDGSSQDLGMSMWQGVGSRRSLYESGIEDKTIPQPLVRLRYGLRRLFSSIYDGRTGKELWDEGLPTGGSSEGIDRKKQLTQAQFQVSPIRLDGGERAWLEEDRYFVGSSESYRLAGRLDAGSSVGGAGRTGFMSTTRGPTGGIGWTYHDLRTGKAFLCNGSVSVSAVGAIGDEILVQDRRSLDSQKPLERQWRLVDDKGHSRLAPHLNPEDDVHGWLSNGRMLISTGTEPSSSVKSDPRSVSSMDWESGCRVLFTFEDGSPAVTTWIWNSGNPDASTLSGQRVVGLRTGGRSVLARVDEEQHRLVRTGGSIFRFITCPDDASALVINDRGALARIRFGEEGEEVLFPRPDDDEGERR